MVARPLLFTKLSIELTKSNLDKGNKYLYEKGSWSLLTKSRFTKSNLVCLSTSRNIHTSRDFGMFSSQKKCCTSSLTWSNKSILAAKECQPDILSAT